MRKINFMMAALVVGMAACNNSSDKTAGSGDSAAKTGTDTSMAGMHHADSSAMITPVPDIPAGAKVYFKNLKDGQSVKSPFKVEMGADGIKVDTAGPIVAGSGHHHLFIDAEDSLPSGTVVPKDEHHMHFGKGQTSTDVTLPAGKHKLTLQYADGIHRSYGSKLATTITVNVK